MEILVSVQEIIYDYLDNIQECFMLYFGGLFPDQEKQETPKHLQRRAIQKIRSCLQTDFFQLLGSDNITYAVENKEPKAKEWYQICVTDLYKAFLTKEKFPFQLILSGSFLLHALTTDRCLMRHTTNHKEKKGDRFAHQEDRFAHPYIQVPWEYDDIDFFAPCSSFESEKEQEQDYETITGIGTSFPSGYEHIKTDRIKQATTSCIKRVIHFEFWNNKRFKKQVQCIQLRDKSGQEWIDESFDFDFLKLSFDGQVLKISNLPSFLSKSSHVNHLIRPSLPASSHSSSFSSNSLESFRIDLDENKTKKQIVFEPCENNLIENTLLKNQSACAFDHRLWQSPLCFSSFSDDRIDWTQLDDTTTKQKQVDLYHQLIELQKKHLSKTLQHHYQLTKQNVRIFKYTKRGFSVNLPEDFPFPFVFIIPHTISSCNHRINLQQQNKDERCTMNSFSYCLWGLFDKCLHDLDALFVSGNKSKPSFWRKQRTEWENEIQALHSPAKQVNQAIVLSGHPFYGLFSDVKWTSARQSTEESRVDFFNKKEQHKLKNSLIGHRYIRNRFSFEVIKKLEQGDPELLKTYFWDLNNQDWSDDHHNVYSLKHRKDTIVKFGDDDDGKKSLKQLNDFFVTFILPKSFKSKGKKGFLCGDVFFKILFVYLNTFSTTQATCDYFRETFHATFFEEEESKQEKQVTDLLLPIFPPDDDDLNNNSREAVMEQGTKHCPFLNLYFDLQTQQLKMQETEIFANPVLPILYSSSSSSCKQSSFSIEEKIQAYYDEYLFRFGQRMQLVTIGFNVPNFYPGYHIVLPVLLFVNIDEEKKGKDEWLQIQAVEEMTEEIVQEEKKKDENIMEEDTLKKIKIKRNKRFYILKSYVGLLCLLESRAFFYCPEWGFFKIRQDDYFYCEFIIKSQKKNETRKRNRSATTKKDDDHPELEKVTDPTNLEAFQQPSFLNHFIYDLSSSSSSSFVLSKS